MVRYKIGQQRHGPIVHLRDNRYQRLQPRRTDLNASFLLRQDLKQGQSRLAMVTGFHNYDPFSRFYDQVNEAINLDLGVVRRDDFNSWQQEHITQQHIVNGKILLETFNIPPMDYGKLKRNHPELYKMLKEVQSDAAWSPVKRIAAYVAAGAFGTGIIGAVALPAAAMGLIAALFGGTIAGVGGDSLYQKVLQPAAVRRKLEHFSATEVEEIFSHCHQRYSPDARELVKVNAQLYRMVLEYPEDTEGLQELTKKRQDLEERLDGLNKVFDSVFSIHRAPRKGQVINYTDATDHVLSFLNRLQVGYDLVPTPQPTAEDEFLDKAVKLFDDMSGEEEQASFEDKVHEIAIQYTKDNSARIKKVSDRHRKQKNREKTLQNIVLRIKEYPRIEDSTNFEPGEILGDRYILQGLIGRGGVGEVWQAKDKDTDKNVAIKLSNGKNPAVFKGDIERARSLRRLNSPHIVSILETHEEVPLYIAEQLVPGTDLQTLIAQEEISVAAAVKIAKGILEAVSVPHAQGMFHRDLKPANVMIQPDGTITLLDFGTLEECGTNLAMSQDLASMAEGASTPIYVAPELWLPGKHKIDTRVDVFSTGVILYEMLTKKLPLGLQSPSHFNKAVTRSLDETVKKMMALEPHERLQVGEGVTALNRILYQLSPEQAIKISVQVPERKIEPIIKVSPKVVETDTPQPEYVDSDKEAPLKELDGIIAEEEAKEQTVEPATEVLYNHPVQETVAEEVQPENPQRISIEQALPLDYETLLAMQKEKDRAKAVAEEETKAFSKQKQKELDQSRTNLQEREKREEQERREQEAHEEDYEDDSDSESPMPA